MATQIIPGVQYSGIWNLNSQAGAVAAATWPVGSPQYLYAWGDGGEGKLAQGNLVYYSSPKLVGNLANWSVIAGGQDHFTSIKTDGTLWSWGRNHRGQLGINSTADRSSPIQVGALTNWLKIESNDHNLAITNDGYLWAWGDNSAGKLGLGNTDYTTSRSSPVQVGALSTWSSISVGAYHSLAIKTDGTLWSWGENSQGQLGHNNTTLRSSPVQVGSLTTWSKIAGGSQHSLAIKTDGTLWVWGYSIVGQLGIGISGVGAARSSPVQVGALTNWLTVAAGNYYNSLAIKTDGTLWAWGFNNNGQLGDGTTDTKDSPVQIGALTTWSDVKGGRDVGKAIKTDGSLWMWGKNDLGQLGLGNLTSYSSPKQVGLQYTWSKVSTGYYATIAIKSQ